jgi:hypothetical protein
MWEVLFTLSIYRYMVELNWFFSWCYDNGHYQTMSVSKGDNLSSRKFLL